MQFQRGNKGSPGRPPGILGPNARQAYLRWWERIFEETNPRQKLTELANANYPEFLRLGIAAMPKDIFVNQVVWEAETQLEVVLAALPEDTRRAVLARIRELVQK